MTGWQFVSWLLATLALSAGLLYMMILVLRGLVRATLAEIPRTVAATVRAVIEQVRGGDPNG